MTWAPWAAIIRSAATASAATARASSAAATLADVVTEAAAWAQDFLRQFGEHQKNVLPWIRPKA